MLSSILQIKTAYEVEGMSPSEIADDQKLDIVAVKSALAQSSAKYRKDCGQESTEQDELNFSNGELQEMNKIILDVARAASYPDGEVDWKTRLAAAVYVRDDKKGRKEAVKQIAGNTFNILNLNEQLQKARESAQQMKQKLIEV